MPRIRYKASRSVPYNGPSGTWQPGDERDVDAEVAARLLDALGEWFEAVGGEPAAAPAIADGSPKDRAYKSGKRKG